MTSFVDFLAAEVPLVKTFVSKNETIDRSPYPMVKNFTSHRRSVSRLSELHTHLLEGANHGWCLLKGSLEHPLVNAPRAGLTNPTEPTQILVLDIDGLTTAKTIQDVLKPLQLAPHAHIIQWSASAHLPEVLGSTPRLSAHVFFWLAQPMAPQLLKSWIMNQCMKHFRDDITLTKSGAALHWPIDPSIMDNGRLIYIAPPILRGMKSRLSGSGILTSHVTTLD